MIFIIAQVPLGIIDKNENRVDEMCHIMDKLHTLVPGKTTVTFFLLPEEENEEILGETFHQLLVGGDQVTAARCRGSAAARCDMDTKTSRLYGLVPVSEDWHAKLCLCKVCYLSSKTQWNLSLIKSPSCKGDHILESYLFTLRAKSTTTLWVILASEVPLFTAYCIQVYIAW